MGWHVPGKVAVCAWERELEREWDSDFVAEHAPILERLGVRTTPLPSGDTRVHWTESSAKAFQLMHILLHELGHHHDRMTTQSQAAAARGEAYAEWYAAAYAERIWDAYFEALGQ